MHHTDTIILGIDPGTNIMGYGLLGVKNGKELYLIEMGVLHLEKYDDHFTKLKKILDKVLQLIVIHQPHMVATEAPFYGKNAQSMLKLGRAQGMALAAALQHDLPIFEYLPRVVKQQITGRGNATKEEVATMVGHTITIPTTPEYLDATDALAVAICHYYFTIKKIPLPIKTSKKSTKKSSWSNFITENPDRQL